MGSSKSSLLYLNVVREVAALCALLWLSSYLMRADLFYKCSKKLFFLPFFLIIEMGKILLCKDQNYSLLPLLTEPLKVIGALKNFFFLS